MLRARIVSTESELLGLVPAWRELYLASGANFVMSPTWQMAWWRSMGSAPSKPFGDLRKVLAVAVEGEGGALVGLSLFASRWMTVAGIPRIRLDAAASGEARRDEVCSEYLTILSREQHRSAVADIVAVELATMRRGRWDELILPSIRSDDPMLEPMIRALVAVGLDVIVNPMGNAHYARLPPTFDAYLAAMRKKERYFIKKTVSDFEAWAGPGGWSFERVRSESHLPEGMSTLVALHEARWGAGHAFARDRFRAFHDEVTRAFINGVDARLELWCLRAGGRPIAALYNVVSGGSVFHYQAGRVTDVPPGVKPGIVANVFGIQRAIAAGLSEYDFLPGEAVYKRQLGTDRHRLVTLRAARSDARAVSLDLASNVLRGIANRVVASVPAVGTYLPGVRKPGAPAAKPASEETE